MAYFCASDDDDHIFDEREHWEVARDLRDKSVVQGWSPERNRTQIEFQCQSLNFQLQSGSSASWIPSKQLNKTIWDFYCAHVCNDIQRDKITKIFMDDMEELSRALMTPANFSRFKDICRSLLSEIGAASSGASYYDDTTAENWKNLVKNIQFVGSSFEKTDIKRPGVEFDMNLILEDDGLLKVQDITNCPGFVTLKLKDNGSSEASQLIYNSSALSPMEIRSKICSEIQKVINNSKKLKGRLIPYYHGPAVQFDRYETISDAKNKTKKLYSVDIVPAYELGPSYGKQIYVAKDLKTLGRPDVISMAWRRSYVQKELNELKRLSKEQKVAYQICKHILHENVELKKISTYHLKNAFLYELRANNNEQNWTFPYTAQRVMGIWRRICQQLKEKNMPVYFCDNINMIDKMQDITRDNMIYRITRFLKDESQFSKLFAQK